MKERRTRKLTGQKQVIAASCLMLILVTCLTGLYIADRMEQPNPGTQLAEHDTAEKDVSEDGAAEPLEAVDSVLLPEVTEKPQENEAAASDGQPEQTDTDENQTSESKTETDAETDAEAVGGSAVAVEQQTPQLQFCGELEWPVAGNVLMNYSMDQSIYFATLDQYKYHPAMVIEAQAGDAVKAAAAGTITQIKEDAQTGCTVCMDIGDGYELQYGQLQELNFKEGAQLEAGDVIGTVAAPTKYYSVEGDNLYFALTKDGAPADPSEYLPQ